MTTLALLLRAGEPVTQNNPDPLVIAIPGILALLGIIASQVWGAWNRKRGNVETKGPSVAEAWRQAELTNSELDVERDWRRDLQDALRTLREEVRVYVRVVRSGGSTEVTTDLQKAIDADPRPPIPR